MSDIRNQKSDYIRFILRSEVSDKMVLDKEPIGWNNDGFEFIRNTKYHGIITQFTGDLSFYNEARDYIKNDKDILGINSNLKLEKYELKEVRGDIRWALSYVGIVDYTTYKDSDLKLSVKFNSNELEDLIKARENDEFDLEREYDINENLLEKAVFPLVDIEGMPLSESLSLSLKLEDVEDGAINSAGDYGSNYARSDGESQRLVFQAGNQGEIVVITPILFSDVVSGSRISSPDSSLFNSDYASKMFFVDNAEENPNEEIITELKFDFSFESKVKTIGFRGSDSRHRIPISMVIARVARNSDTLEYDIVNYDILDQKTANKNTYITLSSSGSRSYFNVLPNEGFMIGFVGTDVSYAYSSVPIKYEAIVSKLNISLDTESNQPKTFDHKFVFVEDCLDRIMYIITGEKNRSVTRLFSKKNELTLEEGEFGSVALTYGLWLRKFEEENELYRSMKISLSDLLESLNAVFNIGVGIEVIDGKQKLVVEDNDFFYQRLVKTKLTNQVSDLTRKTLKNDYYSSIEIGYDKGGDYSDTLGLDEPNVMTERITPIIKNKKEYRQTSSIRADDIGREQLRRKPIGTNSEEKETQQDDNIWFLDVKKNFNHLSSNYIEKTWQDRLMFQPTNMSYAEHFKSFLFTPLRMLFRHGSIIRAGLNEDINIVKKISHINSDSKCNLEMRFKEDDRFYSESENIDIFELDLPATYPESIEFNYKIDSKLVDHLMSKSIIEYKGRKISVPNYYFKIEFTNDEGEIERGYLLSLKLKENKIELVKSNEKINI